MLLTWFRWREVVQRFGRGSVQTPCLNSAQRLKSKPCPKAHPLLKSALHLNSIPFLTSYPCPSSKSRLSHNPCLNSNVRLDSNPRPNFAARQGHNPRLTLANA